MLLRANLTKQAQDLYGENGTTLIKEIKDLNIMETLYIHGMGHFTQ